jgi:general secretion pathway protein J
MTRESGFTLVEVLVATFIMAILSAMGAALISDTLRTRETLESAMSDVQDLELARAILKRDLAQLVARRARGEYGLKAPGQFEGGNDPSGERLMAFVRNGHEVPGLAGRRSRLQHVTYLLRDGSLIRATRAHVDAVPDMVVRERVLMTGLAELRPRFLGNAGWSDVWDRDGASAELSVPRAVALVFEHERFGELETLYLTQAGY